jgi:Tol biopolymer transport system component
VIGQVLGPYRVLDKLGEGGMGEVYRARDTQLNRDVALKVLPAHFADDPDRLARFRREAQVLASLNHPNIAAIYGVQESATTHAIVLELVEGPTLADHIPPGGIPPDEALPIARQIAEALETAHDRAIVHRDLKPANIKLRPDGTVKVLDFGLAKALDPASAPTAEVTASPTITSPAMTRLGMIVGTAAYMSPEQAKGRPADRRSDVWAFGCVLFEMLTGRRPFEGEDVADTLAYVLTREPDWSALGPDTPAHLRRLLRRCLEKDRRKRLADIADARLELEEGAIADAGAPAPGSAARPRPRSASAWLAAAIAIAAAGVVSWNALRSAPAPRDVLRFTVLPPDGHRFAAGPGFLTLSRDGRQLAFITGAAPSEHRLWVRALDSFTAREIPGTQAARRPLWSPDGQAIVFSSGASGLGRLQRVDLQGGRPVTLAEAGIPGAWNEQGVILFTGSGGRIYRVPETGGDSVPVTELDPANREQVHRPSFFLPDGRRFVFQAQSRGGSNNAVYLASLEDPTRVRLAVGISNPEYADGYILFQRAGTLLVQRFDPDAGRMTGSAAPFVEDVDHDAIFDVPAVSVSSTGVLAYRNGGRSRVLTWVSREGRQLATLPLEGSYRNARPAALSPDGRHLAVAHLEGQRSSDIWLIDLDRSVPSRLTFDGVSGAPVWWPDGNRLVFASARKDAGDLYQRNLQTGAEELLYASGDHKRPLAMSPDGKVLLFGQSPTGNPEIWALPLAGDRKPIPIVRTGFPAGNAVFSPDGRWFAYCEGDSGRDQVYVQPYPPTGQRERLSSTSGSSPQWSADRKTVVFVSGDNRVVAVDVDDGDGRLRAGVPRDLFPAPSTFFHRAVLYDSERSRFLLPIGSGEAADPPISIVVNWKREVEALLTSRSGSR